MRHRQPSAAKFAATEQEDTGILESVEVDVWFPLSRTAHEVKKKAAQNRIGR
jgi:hypothetical protein